MEADRIPESVFAFTSDGMPFGQVGEVEQDRFELRIGRQSVWLPVSTARDITAGKLELSLSSIEAQRIEAEIAPR